MMSACVPAIYDHLKQHGTVEGIGTVATAVSTKYDWARECLCRLEEERKIEIIRRGVGRGRKWLIRVHTVRSYHR